MNELPRLFAVIPAAGRSRRMGRPKLLLPLGETTVIARVLDALEHPSIVSRHVVVRRDDTLLADEVLRHGGIIIRPPQDPADMLTSVKIALETIEREFSPRDEEGWLLVPADHPVLDRELLKTMILSWQNTRPRILVPRVCRRRGHPTLFRWCLAREVSQIPVDCGLNWLLQKYSADVAELSVEDEGALIDLDTPKDYARLLERFKSPPDIDRLFEI